MENRLTRLEALEKIGFATAEERKELAEIRAAIAGKGVTPTIDTGTSATQSKDVAIDVEDKSLTYSDTVNLEAFMRGGQQFYMPSKEGTWKSRLVDIQLKLEKNQRWFVFETCDPDLKKQGRGVVVVDLGDGAFKLKDIIDGLHITYKVDEKMGSVDYTIAMPLMCFAEWIKDGKALGQARIGNLSVAREVV